MAKKIRESEVKNRIKKDYFSDYDWTKVVGDIDLTVCSEHLLGTPTTYLWAETKKGTNKDIYESFIQLILTIGKARTYEKEMPPYFLGAADAEKIAFVEYNKVMHIFSKTDFNWNVTPSDHGTKEFKELYQLLHDELAKDIVLYKYAFDDKLIRGFIKKNFKEGRADAKKMSVGKNNFTFVYYDWVKTVKESIAVDWNALQKAGVFDYDFFLADLMSKDGMSIKEKLKVVLEKTKYKVLVKTDIGGMFEDAYKEFQFKDGQKAYSQFWNRYERPPKPVYQRYILDRKDLLVPQDIREIKGSYYTPEKWVRLSQEYLARVLGEDWQEEYYVWDCAAGSGNLLRGLTNPYNIYASTLDDSDVRVMYDAIDGGRLNLIKENVFQFDFLNDGYELAKDGTLKSTLSTCIKIPQSLRNILSDPDKRRHLVIYINSPYAEVSSYAEKGKKGVNVSKVHTKYADQLSTAGRELFSQFIYRVDQEINGCILGEFSTLKVLMGPSFETFRGCFQPRLRSMFLMQADTFDNVKGMFPIGFKIWDTGTREKFDGITADIYLSNASFDGVKHCKLVRKKETINNWIAPFKPKGESLYCGFLCGTNGNDFQHNDIVYLLNRRDQMANPRGLWVTPDNLLACSVYLAIRRIVEHTWLNHNDQYLAPNISWSGDLEFQVDCLIWSVFNCDIREEHNICHWIPYSEEEVHSPSPFNSRFMYDFIHGKISRSVSLETTGDMFAQQEAQEAANTAPIEALSQEANAVLNAGQAIWAYYMTKPGISANASFLDIRTYFQGFKTTEKGKRMMNSSSSDEHYMALLKTLKDSIKALEAHIEPKIYEHGFLLK